MCESVRVCSVTGRSVRRAGNRWQNPVHRQPGLRHDRRRPVSPGGAQFIVYIKAACIRRICE